MGIEIPFYAVLFIIVLCALAATTVEDTLVAVLFLSLFSAGTAVTFAFLRAVDVSMAEAVIGTGFTTAILVTAIARTGCHTITGDGLSENPLKPIIRRLKSLYRRYESGGNS